MLRKLLACLALLTGLAAAGTPAQAGIAGALAARLEISACAINTERAPVAIALAALAGAPDGPPRVGPAPQAVADIVNVPVHVGSDRARE